MPISELLYFLRPVYTHSLSSSHLHSFLASLTRVMLLSCCSFSFSSVRNKLPIPRCIFAAIILSLHALLLLLVSDLLPLSLPVSCVVGNSEYVFWVQHPWMLAEGCEGRIWNISGRKVSHRESEERTSLLLCDGVICVLASLVIFLSQKTNPTLSWTRQ